METINHEGKSYQISKDEPKFGDLVLTDNYGVWEFRNYNDGFNSKSNVCFAPLPYWANKRTCKKMVLVS